MTITDRRVCQPLDADLPTYAAAMMNTKVVAVVLVAALVLTGVGTGLSVLLGR